jgi:cytoskeletal protein RodZ
VSANYTSQAVLVQAPEGDSQFTVPLSVSGGASITAMTATLQVAIKGQSNEWTSTTTNVTKTGASTYTAGPVVQATLQRGYLYRLLITGVTGSDKVIAKLG